VKTYIQNQKKHHLKRSFEDEFIALLRNCGVEYDKRYVFGGWRHPSSLRDSSSIVNHLPHAEARG